MVKLDHKLSSLHLRDNSNLESRTFTSNANDETSYSFIPLIPIQQAANRTFVKTSPTRHRVKLSKTSQQSPQNIEKFFKPDLALN